MRRLLLLIIALATLLPSLAQAYDVLVLQSRRDPGYEEVLKGFRTGNNPSERVIVMSDYAEVDVVRIVREERPKVILAVGDAALAATSGVKSTPVVAVMTLGIHSRKALPATLTGIGMYAPSESYMELFRAMKVNRVGVLFSSAKSGWYLQSAQIAARNAGIELVTCEVSSSRDTLEQLSSLAGKVDALWMLPDTTAVTRETVEAYFRFGQQQAVPVVSFAANYLGLGAAAVIEIDRFALGRQVDAMIAAQLNGAGSGSELPAYPKTFTLKTNHGVLNNLGIALK